MGLGILQDVSLQASIEEWVVKIISQANKRVYDNIKISKAFTNRGYNIITSVDKLSSLYINNGG
jgi:hypothetical protein